MASWKHKAYRHERIGNRLYQVNIPLDTNIHEHEVVALENGIVVEKGVFWDSTNSHMDSIKEMDDYYQNQVRKKSPSTEDQWIFEDNWE